VSMVARGTPVTQATRARRVFRRLGFAGTVSIVGLLLITVVAVFPQPFLAYDPQVRVAAPNLMPSLTHWCGTDEIGRDLFSRIVLALRYTWLPGLSVIVLSLLLGSGIGIVSAYVGGATDTVLQRVTECFLVMPSTVVALAVAASLGPGTINTMIAIAVSWWPWYCIIARDEVRRLKARPHFEAARTNGARRSQLVFRHLLPGATPSLAIAAALDVSNVIMALSLMSFLGLGQPDPAPELGSLTARSLDSLTAFWWLPVFPACAIFLLCLLANVAGESVRQALRGR